MAINVGNLVSVKVNNRDQLGVYAKHIPFDFGDYCIVYLGSNLGENLASEKVLKPKIKVFECTQVKASSEKGDKADNLLKGFKVLKEKGFKFESELNKLDQMKIKFESTNPKFESLELKSGKTYIWDSGKKRESTAKDWKPFNSLDKVLAEVMEDTGLEKKQLKVVKSTPSTTEIHFEKELLAIYDHESSKALISTEE